MTIEQKVKIAELKESGMGYARIANALGISANTVKSYLQRRNNQLAEMCLNCGKEIVSLPHKKKKKFCSDKCRTAWWSRHPEERNGKAFYSYVCPCCGKEFSAYGNRHRVYCSRECHAKARREDNGKEKL